MIPLGRHLRFYVINFRKLIIDTDTKSLFLLRLADMHVWIDIYIYIWLFIYFGGGRGGGGYVQQMYIYLHIPNTEVLVESCLLLISAMLYYILALFGNWIDFNFKSSFDIAMCKPKDVQSLQSSYFLVFYHFGFEGCWLLK